MVRFQIDEVSEDMILGESIFLPSGELLLSAGYRIKKRYCDRLRDLGYSELMIQVEGTEDVIPQMTVQQAVQREMLSTLTSTSKGLKNLCEHFRQQGHKSIEDAVRSNRQHLGKYIMSAGIQAAIEKFIEEIMKQPEVVLNLSAMQQTSQSLFAHAMNVTITALCLGRKYRFTYEELKQLAIGAINYDIGMVALPKEIIEKEEPLTSTEQETLKQHTTIGYLMLSEMSTIPPTSAACALQHHEHQDGTGYPRGIPGENRPPLKDFTKQHVIHRFAEIVAVADRYDMLSSGRQYYGQKISIQDTMKELIKLSGPVLNSDVVKTLISIIPAYPIGARVRVTQAPSAQLVGYTGTVARDNPANLEKPQIILYETRKHQRVAPIFIDLSKHEGLMLELVT